MSENKIKTRFSMDDMMNFKNLFHKHGYAIVNDFEIPDDELGFDITGNETIQESKVSDKLFTGEDMSDIESYLNGSGYSVVSDTQSDRVVINTQEFELSNETYYEQIEREYYLMFDYLQDTIGANDVDNLLERSESAFEDLPPYTEDKILSEGELTFERLSTYDNGGGNNVSVLDKYMGWMALFRTCASISAVFISSFIMMRVW